MSVELLELDDAAWEIERNNVAQRFLGISATEFVRKVQGRRI